ncbi:MAG: hypothetical protein J6I55_11710 [Ruminococcus sp.]|nr:hypothetical protein [Ruminococcus sp.]
MMKVPKIFQEQWQKNFEQSYDFYFHELSAFSAFSDLENVDNVDSSHTGDYVKSEI